MKVNHTGFCMDEMDTEKCYDCPTVKDCIRMWIRDLAEPVIADMKRAERDAKADGMKDILEVIVEEVEPEPPGCSSSIHIYEDWERDNDEANIPYDLYIDGIPEPLDFDNDPDPFFREEADED